MGDDPRHRLDRSNDRSGRPLGVGREEGQEISGPALGQKREGAAGERSQNIHKRITFLKKFISLLFLRFLFDFLNCFI